ncbi:hypothetical protein KR018_011498 [Drosophila ironensis]|nr:hypothetical protein KR018_006968 [Drosophila ironensis]KAH8299272.1 hypothetical protein KR018_011498 [Drosophila ironensis]
MSKPQKANPSAPAHIYPNAGEDMAMRAPPPSYEESQRSGGAAGHPPAPQYSQNHYYGMISHHQQAAPGYGLAGPSTSAGAAASRVLQLDPRAEVTRAANGSVVVPPPPPGCLPTPAQWAAMQGQQVVLKQKKRSFF